MAMQLYSFLGVRCRWLTMAATVVCILVLLNASAPSAAAAAARLLVNTMSTEQAGRWRHLIENGLGLTPPMG